METNQHVDKQTQVRRIAGMAGFHAKAARAYTQIGDTENAKRAKALQEKAAKLSN